MLSQRSLIALTTANLILVISYVFFAYMPMGSLIASSVLDAFSARSGVTSMTLVQAQPFAALDPHADVPADAVALNLVYEPLIRFDQFFNLVPALASSWYFRDDTHFVASLREGASFQDDAHVSCADVVASLDRAKKLPSSGLAALFRDTTVAAENDTTCVFTLASSDPTFLRRLTHFLIIPAAAAKQFPTSTPTELVGSGAYRLSDREGSMLMFSRFAAHPTASDGIPQSVTLIAEPKKYNRLAMLRRGDADVLLDTPASFVPQIEARMGYRIAQVPTYESLFFLFNFAHTHLADTATRTHLARLIASLDIAKKLNDPSLYALTQFAPSGVFGFAPDLVDGKTTTKSFDDTLFLTVGVTETNRKIVEILQTELEPKGVKLAIETVSDAELADGVKTGRFDAALFGWQYGLGTVDEFFTKLVHSPRDGRGEFAGYGYRSRAADDTIDAALRETNVKKRLADWQDVATRIVARDVIGAPLLGTRRLYAVREGFAFTPRMDGLVIFTADDEND